MSPSKSSSSSSSGIGYMASFRSITSSLSSRRRMQTSNTILAFAMLSSVSAATLKGAGDPLNLSPMQAGLPLHPCDVAHDWKHILENDPSDFERNCAREEVFWLTEICQRSLIFHNQMIAPLYYMCRDHVGKHCAEIHQLTKEDLEKLKNKSEEFRTIAEDNSHSSPDSIREATLESRRVGYRACMLVNMRPCSTETVQILNKERIPDDFYTGPVIPPGPNNPNPTNPYFEGPLHELPEECRTPIHKTFEESLMSMARQHIKVTYRTHRKTEAQLRQILTPGRKEDNEQVLIDKKENKYGRIEWPLYEMLDRLPIHMVPKDYHLQWYGCYNHVSDVMRGTRRLRHELKEIRHLMLDFWTNPDGSPVTRESKNIINDLELQESHEFLVEKVNNLFDIPSNWPGSSWTDRYLVLCQLLTEAVEQNPTKKIWRLAEIGVFEGHSSIALLNNCDVLDPRHPSQIKLQYHLIDPWSDTRSIPGMEGGASQFYAGSRKTQQAHIDAVNIRLQRRKDAIVGHSMVSDGMNAINGTAYTDAEHTDDANTANATELAEEQLKEDEAFLKKIQLENDKNANLSFATVYERMLNNLGTNLHHKHTVFQVDASLYKAQKKECYRKFYKKGGGIAETVNTTADDKEAPVIDEDPPLIDQDSEYYTVIKNAETYNGCVWQVSELNAISIDVPGIFIHKATSIEASERIPDLDITFIDGDHSLEGVTKDLALFGPKTQLVLAGHDWNLEHHQGVPLAVTSMMLGARILSHVKPLFEPPIYLDSDYMWWLRRKSRGRVV